MSRDPAESNYWGTAGKQDASFHIGEEEQATTEETLKCIWMLFVYSYLLIIYAIEIYIFLNIDS